jgi:hypothetical protein
LCGDILKFQNWNSPAFPKALHLGYVNNSKIYEDLQMNTVQSEIRKWSEKYSIFPYGSTPIQVASMKLSVSLQLLDLGQLDGWSACRKASTCAQTQKNAHTTQTLNIYALSGIQTHGPSARPREDNSCLRPLGYGDRLASERAKTVQALDRSATVTSTQTNYT